MVRLRDVADPLRLLDENFEWTASSIAVAEIQNVER